MSIHLLQEIYNKNLSIDPKKKELFFRSFEVDAFSSNSEKDCLFSGRKFFKIRFDTYFAMFSISKWYRYSKANEFYCKVKITGAFELRIYSLSDRNTENLLTTVSNNSGVFDDVIMVPKTSEPYVFVELRFEEQPEIEELFWASNCQCLNNIKLCLAICTFKKEQYVYRNIRNFKQLFESYPNLLDDVKIIISDNGRSLDASKIELPNVYIYQNDNLGGSGGYGRAMIEACQNHSEFTHLFLMDDDVEILGSSLLLAFNMLRELKGEYLNHCIEFMNFNLDYPDMLIVGMEYTDKLGIKGIHDKNAVFRPDLVNMGINTYHPHQYGGWWGSIIPHKFINIDNLPMPLFFQLDDIEFAFRNKLEYIMLNGLCVWHDAFYKKIQASKLYFWFRNWLIVNPLQNIMLTKKIKHNIYVDFKRALTQFDYDEAQCLLKAYEDFLRGPTFNFDRENTFKALRDALALNEKFKSFDDDLNLCNRDYLGLCSVRKLRGIKRILFGLTFNGHLIPLPRRFKESYSFYDATNRRAFYRNTKVTVINPHYCTYAVREFNFERGFKLILRWYYLRFVSLFKEKNVVAEYKSKYKYVTSFEFWKKYLNI